jgi:hypothetical protein
VGEEKEKGKGQREGEGMERGRGDREGEGEEENTWREKINNLSLLEGEEAPQKAPLEFLLLLLHNTKVAKELRSRREG